MLFFFTPKSDQKEIILTILITVEAGREEQEKYPLKEIYENKTNFSALIYQN